MAHLLLFRDCCANRLINQDLTPDAVTMQKARCEMRKIMLATALALIPISVLAIALSQERTWGGPDVEEGDEVAVAPDGSVYVAGTTLSFGAGDRDAFLLKFAPDGSLAWQRTYGTGPVEEFARADEFGLGVAAAPDGSAYVTGQFADGNLFLAKFDPNGTLLWQRTWGDNGNVSNGVEVAADGSVYVSGITFTFDVGQGDAILLKFTPAGSLVWARTWGGPFFDAARDVAIGADGGIYIAGDTNSFFANDAFVVKFAPDGTVLWARDWGTQGAAGTGFTAAFGVGTAPDGSVYITGNSNGTGVDETVILVKFDANGALVWETLAQPRFGTGLDVAVGVDGNVYVTGIADPDAGGDLFVLKLLPTGRARETRTWGGAEPESGASIAAAPDGSLVVAGYAGAPPYRFRRGQHRTTTPNSFLLTATGTVTVPAGLVATPAGVVTSPNGSLTFAGATDAAMLRLQP